MIHAKRQKRSIVIDKRKEIQNAAIDVFARKGYHQSSIKEVADKAGVATGTIYLYYKNKDDLLFQATKALMDSSLAEVKKKIAEEKLAVDKLFMFFYHHIEVFTKKPSLARFLVVEMRQSEDFYKRHPSYNPYYEYQIFVNELVKKAISEGTTKPYSPETISILILGAMDAVLTQWIISPESISLEKSVNEIRDILHNGLKTEK